MLSLLLSGCRATGLNVRVSFVNVEDRNVSSFLAGSLVPKTCQPHLYKHAIVNPNLHVKTLHPFSLLGGYSKQVCSRFCNHG